MKTPMAIACARRCPSVVIRSRYQIVSSKRAGSLVVSRLDVVDPSLWAPLRIRCSRAGGEARALGGRRQDCRAGAGFAHRITPRRRRTHPGQTGGFLGPPARLPPPGEPRARRRRSRPSGFAGPSGPSGFARDPAESAAPQMLASRRSISSGVHLSGDPGRRAIDAPFLMAGCRFVIAGPSSTQSFACAA